MISITHLDQKTKNLIFPKGIWIYFVSWHDSDGYGMHIQDMKLRIYNRGSTGNGYKPRGARYATSSQILIAPNFNGYIQGLKFYKGIQRTEFRAIDYVNEVDSSKNLIWYYRLQ